MKDPRTDSKLATSKLCFYCQVSFPTPDIMHKHVFAKHPGSDAANGLKRALGLVPEL